MFFAVLLCGCSERQTDEAEQSVDPYRVSYGPVRPILAFWAEGFETSDLLSCEGARENCYLRFGKGNDCWAEFTEQAWQEASDILAPEYELGLESGGQFWLEGEGRVATQSGGFGHMGFYSCQVELTKVHAIEEIDMAEELGMPSLDSLTP